MPVKEKSIEDFTRLWSQYDKLATGFITIKDLESLIIDLSKANPEEGGALVPFGEARIFQDEFRNRLI